MRISVPINRLKEHPLATYFMKVKWDNPHTKTTKMRILAQTGHEIMTTLHLTASDNS